jgi:ATP-binding cassette subfamily B multidrug efflux pump
MSHLLRLIPFLKPYLRQVSLSLLSLALLTSAQLALPTVIQRVIDVGLKRGEESYLVQAALVILGLGTTVAGLTYVQRMLNEWIAAHIGFDLRNKLYDHIQSLSFSFHDHAQTGQLISRCIEDVRAVERFTGFGVVDLIKMIFLLSGIIWLLFTQNPRLAVIALLPTIPLMLMTTSFGQRVSKLFFAVDNAMGELSSRLQENVTGVQVVRAFAREPFEIERFRQANRIVYDARVLIISQWSRILPSSHFLVSLGTILILWFGGMMVLQGELSVGQVVAFNAYMLMLATPAQQLTWLVNLAGEAVAGTQRAFEVLDRQPQIQSPPHAAALPPLSGKVEFRDVCFRYQEEDLPVLEDISVTVQPNQLVALIGPTGSGKSSLVNLVPRFYDVSQGAVLVDGIDVRQAELKSLRRQIGVVLQSSLLFSDSIRENIAFGRPEAGEDEIIAAAKASQAHDFILQLPQGYDTIVGERGVTLSGGQRQRVAIARALLLDPRILILDDSTSSVDTHTEQLIQKALDNLMIGRTTFVIAHRLSTVRRADLILVMDAGRIAERGTHRDLLQAGGLYREIYDLQLRDQERFHSELEALSESDQSPRALPERSEGSRSLGG